ncbi:MAG TPA: glycoside hydrolase family 78 protein [Sphingobacteriaceae bacterium]
MKQLLVLLIFSTHSFLALSQKLTVTDLTCDYKINPIGIGTLNSGFSWKIASKERNVIQKAYQLRVATDQADLKRGKNLIWDSGKVNTDQSTHISFPVSDTKSGQRYFWQVKVWDNKGNASAWSKVNFWETGLNKSDWSAKWIEANQVTDGKVVPVPMFFKAFKISSPIKSARLYITAHGLYEAKLNGAKVSNHLLTPGWTSYENRLQYQVYDVTEMLKQGSNSTVVSVGDGWYRGNLQWTNKRNFFGKEPGLLYQLEITHNDGTKQVIVSDNSWRSSFDSPIRSSDIYNGETFDSRLDKTILSDESIKNWQPVRVVNYSMDNIVAQEGPPVIKHEEFKPVKFITTPKGEKVIDFGQNLVGWVQLKVKGKSGDTIKIYHAEVLDSSGNFYTENLRSAKQENIYVLNGMSQVLEPHFTFQGFRFIKIVGQAEKMDTENFTAVAIYSDMQPTGDFTSSHSLLNQLQHNIQWGQKGNFVDIPTDCPQRDERLGWTGDAQVFFNTAAYNMNVASFFTKWLQDVKADQYADGRIPAVIPVTQKRANDGSAGWADVGTIIPWNFYEAYGDKSLLSRQYESMKKWVDYISSVSKNNLWNNGSHYGDWLFYTMADDRDGKAALTDKHLIAQAFYAASTQNVINAANILGRTEDVSKYTALLSDVKDAFNKEYVTPSGRLVSSSQTAYVLALYFDLLPESSRKQAAVRLVENIKSYKDHITTGFLGTPYICHVLTRYGYTDVAYKLLMQETYPSWLYPVKKGATTIWERWDGIKPDGSFQATSMNSFNHYAYGAIGDWMYRTIGGIAQSKPGYKQISIAPQPGGGLTSAAADLETLYGKLSSSWKLDGNRMSLEVEVPPNTTAKVVLPKSASAEVTESGTTLSKVKDITVNSGPDKDIELTLGSGTYEFEYTISSR